MSLIETLTNVLATTALVASATMTMAADIAVIGNKVSVGIRATKAIPGGFVATGQLQCQLTEA